MASTSTSGRGGQQKRDPFLVLQTPNEKIKSSLTAKQFDVFINHRGPDVKTTLARQLYDSLQQAGIPAYLDSEETELGDHFPSAIKNAISSATVHIAILSPRYAESAWCLAELSFMFQTKARIIPLFYHVDPSDFRHIKGGVAGAFSKHEERGRYPHHDIQQWKDCLENVSWLKGYELSGQNIDPHKLCNDVVSAVVKEKQKRKIPLKVAKYAVGLDDLVKDFHSHCQRNGEMRDKIIGIFGMGGSGKTTLAKDLFNRKHSEFSRSTCLFDVRESDVQGKLTSLQNKLIYDLFPGNHQIFVSIEEGIALIEDNLRKNGESRFLLIIDDVDNQKQLDALIPLDALNLNSLVIVTTRDERLLIKAGVRVRYKMQEMNREHSRELFCWHAFHTQSCKRGFENLVNSFVQVCGGLPLALQVMGGHVFGSDKVYWKLQLDVVKARLDKDIKDRLKISYDALEEDQKQIFMDIACFFIGEDVSTAVSIWKASGWRAEHALQTLKDKCLVQVQTSFDQISHDDIKCHYTPKYTLRMHDHLRDLGREMADNEMTRRQMADNKLTRRRHRWMGREMADNEMTRRHRPWPHRDLIGLSNIKDFKNALTACKFRCCSFFYENGFRMNFFLGSSQTSTGLQWLQLESDGCDMFIPEWIPLQNLHILIFFQKSFATLCQRDDQVPLELRELYYSLKNSIASQQYLNELVSSFRMFKHLESLYLNFGSARLEWNFLLKSVKELTNLHTFQLEWFNVEGEIDLSYRGIRTTDDRFCMRSLEAISLCGVCSTRKVSIHGQFCPALKSLKLCSMKDLIGVDLMGLTTLESLVMLKCGQLREVLGSDLLNLETVHIKLCRTMTELPNLGHASCLKKIYVSRCRSLQDISAIERLKELKRVWIAYCPELKSVKAIEQLKGLKRIWIEECAQLQDVICFEKLKELKRIFIGRCVRLQSIRGIEFLIRLESFIIAGCPKLQSIRGIEELKGLKEIIISDSPMISCVQRLQMLPSEVTILVGRSAVSDLIADEDGTTKRSAISYFNVNKISDTLSMADVFCEIKFKGNSRDKIEGMMDSFQKTHHSVGTFIFCAMLSGSPRIGSDICNGTTIVLEKGTRLGCATLCFDYTYWIYTCIIDQGRLSKYETWMHNITQGYCSTEKAFLMGVEKGEESKTLPILRSLFAQLCVYNCGYSEDMLRYNFVDPRHFEADLVCDELGSSWTKVELGGTLTRVDLAGPWTKVDLADYDDFVDHVDDEGDCSGGDDGYNDNEEDDSGGDDGYHDNDRKI